MEKYGLTTEEVKTRIAKHQVNRVSDDFTRTYGQIFSNNIFTLFNFINVLLFVFVLIVGSPQNGLFIGIVISNILIGTVQEIKAKKLLDKISLLVVSKIKTYRDGEIVELTQDKLVIDDNIILSTGQQVPCDAQLLTGKIDVNESMLTGESDTVSKRPGDILFSGSVVTSGQAVCQIYKVGNDSYIHQLASKAKKINSNKRELRDKIDRLIRVLTFIIIPLGILLFLRQVLFGTVGFDRAVLNTVAAMTGMLPQGLVLLTSMALTLGVIRLARKKVLVQELHTLDTLARIDTLCLDKTGTITTGQMQVEQVEMLTEHVSLDDIMPKLLSNLSDGNATFEALKNRFSVSSDKTASYIIPFSSERKYSGASFPDEGSYYIGALEFLFPENNEALKARVQHYSHLGFRVLVLAHSPWEVQNVGLAPDLEPLAFIVISDIIREEARKTLEYFHEQGVTCKVISGDDPTTVSAIAQRVALRNADKIIDMSTVSPDENLSALTENFTVFGRVSPQQKERLISAMKQNGHTVAMTGDGVNDILAFKEADCSIAMSAGSDATKNVANLVLLENDFSTLPSVVNEGRRVVNNMSRSGVMLMTKVIFSMLLAVLTVVLGHGYPFLPIHITLLNTFFVSVPSFFLNLEQDFSPIKGNFLTTIFKGAFPAAMVVTVVVSVLTQADDRMGLGAWALSTMIVLFTGFNYVLLQRSVYKEKTAYRMTISNIGALGFLIAMLFGAHWFELAGIGYGSLILLLILLFLTPYFQKFVRFLVDVGEKLVQKRQGKQT